MQFHVLMLIFQADKPPPYTSIRVGLPYMGLWSTTPISTHPFPQLCAPTTQMAERAEGSLICRCPGILSEVLQYTIGMLDPWNLYLRPCTMRTLGAVAQQAR